MYQKQDYTGSLMNSEEEEWMKNYEKRDLEDHLIETSMEIQ